MAEPLSTTASIVAVVGFAAESSKLVVELFRKLARTSANVHDSLLAVASLHLILNDLQDCGSKLDQSYRFLAHFQDRVNECLKNLRAFEIKIDEIDAIFDGERTSRHH